MSYIFTIENVYKAYIDCRKRKKNTANALRFEIEREKNIIALLNELKAGRYQISRHICFVVKDPTVREVFAADFRDRVVHHLIYNELKDLFEKDFIENSFANRLGKGTHKGVEKVKEYLKTAEKGDYLLKLDIKSLFRSINKDILFRIISERVESSGNPAGWKREILWLVRKIIYHDPTQNYSFKGNEKDRELIPKEKSLFYAGGRGLPIGNLTSQFFANIYLDQLDRFILSLGYKKYIRYVDDFIILGGRETVQEIPKIKTFLKEKLDLELSEKKIKFQQARKGVDFLGYYIKPNYSLVRRKIVRRFKEKVRAEEKNITAVANSYFGHFVHANSYNLRKSIYEKHFKYKYKFKGEYKSIYKKT
jgi:retron-type reverse transcriptase